MTKGRSVVALQAQRLKELRRNVELIISYDSKKETRDYYMAYFLNDVSCLDMYRRIPFGDVYDTVEKAVAAACLGR